MILYRYVLKKHFPPFIYSIAIILFISIVNYAVRILDKIISKGLEPGVVLEIFLVNLGWMVALAVPMATLTATLMAFGSMSADNEMAAIRASGIPLYKLLIAPLSASSVLCVLLIFFNNLILPDANHRTASLMSDISRKHPAAFIEPKVLIDEFSDYGLYVERVKSKTGRLYGIKVFSQQKGGRYTTTVADSGEIIQTHNGRFLRLTLFHGASHQLGGKEPGEYIVSSFNEQILVIKNKDTKLQRRDRSHRSDREKSSEAMLRDVKRYTEKKRHTVSQYNAFLDSLQRSVTRWDSLYRVTPFSPDTAIHRSDSTFMQWRAGIVTAQQMETRLTHMQKKVQRYARTITRYEKNSAKYMVEVHKKFSIPFACIVFVLIGSPLGIMARRGGIAVGASYSILFFIIYWALLIQGEKLADELVISPFLAMWSGNILIGACALVLVSRLGRRRMSISFAPLLETLRSWAARLHRNPVIRAMIFIASLPVKGCFLFLLLFRRISGILPLYIIRLFLGYVIGITVAIIVVFVTVDYVSNSGLFSEAGTGDIARYYLYYMPWILPMIFPVINLLASMAVVGKLVGRREIDAMRASGISVVRAFSPLLLVGLLFTGGTFLTREALLPQANMKREVLKSRLKGHGERMAGRHNRRDFYYFANDSTVYFFERLRGSRNSGRKVWGQYFTKSNRMRKFVQAEKASWRDSSWYLYNGVVRYVRPQSDSFAQFDTLKDVALDVSARKMATTISSPLERSYWELHEYIQRAKRRGEEIQEYLAELHFKMAFPFMNFIVILLGVSIAARIGRRGGAVLFGIGIFVSFFYWMGARFVLEFGKNGYISPILGAWIGNVIFFVIGIWLYATTDR